MIASVIEAMARLVETLVSMEPFLHFPESDLALGLVALLCAYTGVFVVCKRVVFVGVALAEVSAAGIAFSFFTLGLFALDSALGDWWHRWGAVVSSGLFTVAGLALLSWSRLSQRVSREALIGLGHAGAGAVAILLVWRSPEGLEELRHLLHGDVLFAHLHHLALLLGVAVLIGLVHGVFRGQLLFTALDADMARTLGLRVGLWEAVLFGTLGLAIALSTWVGGVMLAFGLLVIPPFTALAVSDRFGGAVALSLGIGLGATGVGLGVAVAWDLPTPPAVIATTLVPLAAAGLERLFGLRRLTWVVVLPGLLLSLAGFGVATVKVVSEALAIERLVPHWPLHDRDAAEHEAAPDHGPHGEHRHDHRRHELPESQGAALDALLARLRSADPRERAEAARALAHTGHALLTDALIASLEDDAPEVRAAALSGLTELCEPGGAVPAILEASPAWTADLRLDGGRAALALGDRRGASLLLGVLVDPSASIFVREEAAEALRALRGGEGFGYDALEGPTAEVNVRAIRAWRAFLDRGE